MRQLRAIWAYRFFIFSSIVTDFRSRFVRSKLGGAWMVLNPLAQVAIYALVLSTVLAAKLPGIDNQYAYAIYLMAGTLAWSLFSEIFTRSLNIFIENGNLIKKMAFPKITLPLITLGSALVNNILLFVAVLLVFGLLGHIPSINIIYLPILVLITLLLSMGLGLIFGIINVFMRDIGQFMSIAINFWFWLTPIVYISNILPEKFQTLILFNPMTAIVLGYQNILVYDKSPNFSLLCYPIILAIISCIVAFFMYLRANEEMADVL